MWMMGRLVLVSAFSPYPLDDIWEDELTMIDSQGHKTWWGEG